jgi:hypothetical protein
LWGITEIKLIKRQKNYLSKDYDFVGSDVHHDNHINALIKKIILNDVIPLQEVIKNNQFFYLILILTRIIASYDS